MQRKYISIRKYCFNFFFLFKYEVSFFFFRFSHAGFPSTATRSRVYLAPCMIPGGSCLERPHAYMTWQVTSSAPWSHSFDYRRAIIAHLVGLLSRPFQLPCKLKSCTALFGRQVQNTDIIRHIHIISHIRIIRHIHTPLPGNTIPVRSPI